MRGWSSPKMILSKGDIYQSLCGIPNVSLYAICLLAIMRAVTAVVAALATNFVVWENSGRRKTICFAII